MRALERRLFACVPRAARALLELASEQPAPRGGLSSPESMLDLERISHSCTRGGAGTLRCDCVRYAAP